MRPYLLTATLAAALLSSAGAFAFHPVDRNVRGALDPEQLDRIESLHVQSGWYHGGPTASQARQAAAHQARASAPNWSERFDR